jgi:hypothetical protein
MKEIKKYKSAARVLWPGNPVPVPGQLVQPQAAKKKDTFGTGPRNTKLSTLKTLLASTNAMESGTTPGKPLKPASG